VPEPELARILGGLFFLEKSKDGWSPRFA